MSVQASNVERLHDEAVPPEHRGWVNMALTLPINRVFDLFRALIDRGISLRHHVNAQVVELRLNPPTSSVDITEQLDWSGSRFDTPSTLAGPCLGLQVLQCWTVDSAGHDVAPVGNLPSPAWREVVLRGKNHIRLLYQFGLTSGVRYRIVMLAWGQ